MEDKELLTIDPEIDDEDVLEHYGILGMKWGVRRYQNEDGTLTEAGKKHYDSLQEKTKKAILSGDPKQVQKYAEHMTNQELQNAVNRVDMMSKIKIKSVASDVSSKLQTVTNLVNNVVNAKNAFDRFSKLFDEENDSEQKEKIAAEKERAERVSEAIKRGNPKELVSLLGEMTKSEAKEAQEKLESAKAITKHYSKYYIEQQQALNITKAKEKETAKEKALEKAKAKEDALDFFAYLQNEKRIEEARNKK